MCTDGRKRSLRFVELDTGCYVCVSHKTNHDGYLRMNIGNRNLKMFHRIMWKMHRGSIPADYEINHLCGNRACQNIDHMECIPGKEHAVLTNQTRYLARKNEAIDFWKKTGCSGTKLSEHFNVSPSATCKWIKEARESM